MCLRAIIFYITLFSLLKNYTLYLDAYLGTDTEKNPLYRTIAMKYEC